jgi:hypothetical protein
MEDEKGHLSETQFKILEATFTLRHRFNMIEDFHCTLLIFSLKQTPVEWS